MVFMSASNNNHLNFLIVSHSMIILLGNLHLHSHCVNLIHIHSHCVNLIHLHSHCVNLIHIHSHCVNLIHIHSHCVNLIHIHSHCVNLIHIHSHCVNLMHIDIRVTYYQLFCILQVIKLEAYLKVLLTQSSLTLFIHLTLMHLNLTSFIPNPFFCSFCHK